jgi:alkanesulfonate monooxygenase SsuD/methylene tetrahydromethanopterin reductase-like flavin-dependent oxidoreductase (luciferase family)
MRIGVILPSFRDSASEALAAAAEAEDAGLHGVFAYNHLWPMGQPGRPALSPFPLLGAVVARTERLAIGTLVARVGLTPDDVLVEELLTLEALSGGRFVAGVGTGDAKSADENLAFGVAYPSAHERRERLAAIVATLLAAGVTAWVGGGAAATNEVARSTGAVLNLWAATPAAVAKARRDGEVTWGGMLPRDPGAAAALLEELEDAGASWAVFNWPGSSERIVAASSTARLELG